MSASTASAGYRITTPSGWSRLTVGAGADAARDRFVASRVRHLSGRDRVLGERRLTAIVDRVIAEAQSAGALDLYYYSRVIRRIPVTMSFTIGVVYLGAAIDELGDEALFEVAGVDGGVTTTVSIAGQRAVRVTNSRVHDVAELRAQAESLLGDIAADEEPPTDPAFAAQVDDTVDALAAQGIVPRAIRVSYLFDIPDAPGAYILAAFDAPEGPLAEATAFHFDTVMSSFRWENR